MSDPVYSIKSIEEFRKLFQVLDSRYREGAIEDGFISIDNDFNIHELNEIEAAETENAISLRELANRLYQFGEIYWNDDDLAFPEKDFQYLLRAMTISFELDERFLNLTDKKRKLFREFNEEFLKEQKLTTQKWIDYLEEIGRRKKILPGKFNDDDLLNLANEMALFSLCGINVRLLTHSSTQYKIGLEEVRRLDSYLKAVSQKKIEKADKEGKAEEMRQKQEQASGLCALNYFLKGRLHLGSGEFRKAEKAFKKSRTIYFQNVNRLIFAKSDAEIRSRSLSMRRANLVEVIGLVNLYYAESRVDEAFEILNRVTPLLQHYTGKLMTAYCNLLRIRILRAKFSSEEEHLKALEDTADECEAVFEKYVPGSHFLEYIRIERSLIRFYQAELLEPAQAARKPGILNECLENLKQAIEFGEAPREDLQPKNRRILVEAYNLRSHIHRNYAELDGGDFWKTIEEAQQDADAALEYAKDLKQYESEAAYMSGAVYLKKYRKALKEYQKALAEREIDDNQQLREEIRDWSNRIDEYFKKAQELFYTALTLNTEENAKVKGVGLLRLTELEILNNTNFANARFYFQKYEEEIKPRVGHVFLLKYADNLKKMLGNRSKKLDFHIDIRANRENLKLSYWKAEIERFLIYQTIYLTAVERKGELPARRNRGPGGSNNNPETGNTIRSRETQQSVLANAFINKMGMPLTKAYLKADEYLKEFIFWCQFVREAKETGNKDSSNF